MRLLFKYYGSTSWELITILDEWTNHHLHKIINSPQNLLFLIIIKIIIIKVNIDMNHHSGKAWQVSFLFALVFDCGLSSTCFIRTWSKLLLVVQ